MDKLNSNNGFRVGKVACQYRPSRENRKYILEVQLKYREKNILMSFLRCLDLIVSAARNAGDVPQYSSEINVHLDTSERHNYKPEGENYKYLMDLQKFYKEQNGKVGLAHVVELIVSKAREGELKKTA